MASVNIGILVFLLMLPVSMYIFFRLMWAAARQELGKAREEFKAITGHYPKGRENWFRWKP